MPKGKPKAGHKGKPAPPSPAPKPNPAVPIGEAVSIDLLAEDPANPRDITFEAFTGLRTSLEVHGDLAKIVFNLTTGELVAGHKRMKALREDGAKTWKRVSDTEGEIVHPKTGERFAIRLVKWDRKKQRSANLTANNHAITGDWRAAQALDQIQELDHDDTFAMLELGELEAELAEQAAALERELGAATGGSTDPGGPTPCLVVVECRSKRHQAKVFKELTKLGYTCRTD